MNVAGNFIAKILSTPSAKDIGVAVGVLTGAAVAITFDLPAGLPRILAGVAAGVPAGFLTTKFVLGGKQTDDPVNDPTPSEKLVATALDLVIHDGVQGAATFGLVTLGFVTATVVLYDVLLAAEIDAFLEILPIMRRENVPLFLVLIGVGASCIFAGIAGWTIEVLLWAAEGGHLTTHTKNTIPGVPARPGARHKWGWEEIPKDAFKLLFAFPLAIFRAVKSAAKNKSLVPLIFVPMVTVLDQWHRLGDVIVDVFCPPNAIKHLDKVLVKTGKSAAKFAASGLSNLQGDKMLVGAGDTTLQLFNPPMDYSNPDSPKPTTTSWKSLPDNAFNYPTFENFLFASYGTSEKNPTGTNIQLFSDMFDYVFDD